MKRTLKMTLCAAFTVAFTLSACNASPSLPVTPSVASDDAQTTPAPSKPVARAQTSDLASTQDNTPTPRATLVDQTFPTAGPPLATPTLDPPLNLPGGAITSTYTVRVGDTLSGIAAATGATVEELQRINGITNPDSLNVGQELLVRLPIDERAPAVKLIPDSELVNSPSAASFDVHKFAAAHQGYLTRYSEQVDGVEMLGPDIVVRIAQQYSVHPRLLLALLEYKSGWVDNPTPAGDQLLYPLGYNRTDLQSLYLQLSWAAARLNEGYYGWRLSTRLWVRLDDGNRAYMGEGINAGTAGLQNYLAAISTRPVWLNVLGEQGFIKTYRALFGDPWGYDLGQLVPEGLQQPTFTLPWRKGETWLLTGGPHSAWGTGTPWAALDFTSWNVSGCDELFDWVTAVTNGVIARSVNGEVVQSLDPSGDERIGWSVLYMHIGTTDRVKVGDQVQTGSRIGHPSCEGGVGNGSHVHIVRKYNGEWINAAGAIPFNLGGWTPVEGGQEYDGIITNGKLTRTPCECKEININGISW